MARDREDKNNPELVGDVAARLVAGGAGSAAGRKRRSRQPTAEPPLNSERSPLDDGLPYCDFCKGLRWVRADVPVGHSDFGQLVPCPECGDLAERQRRRKAYRTRRARIQAYTQNTGRYSRQTFENFDQRQGERGTASIRRAYEAAWAFAQNPQGWLVLYGTKGTGKSHLAAAVANHLESPPEEERPLVMFITAPDLLDLLRSGYSVGDYDELLWLTRTVDVLILDDLGVERVNEWVDEKLFQILNYRYQAELPTMVVTNCRLEDLEPRIYDRLSDDDFCVRVEVLAPTYRQRRSNPGEVVQ